MKKSFNQSGLIHTLPLLIIVAAVGIISFLLISSTLPLNGLFGVINPKQASHAATSGCGLTDPAFCETFDQGPSALRGRGGDLDPSKWSVARLAPSNMSDPSSGIANPVMPAPIPACRSSFNQTSVYPPNDTLICDANGTLTPQLMTATAIQYYGNNSYMIRQPFDFASRTGKIDFDVDAVTTNIGGYFSVDITDDPIPAPTYREVQNYEVGPTPKNAIIIKFQNLCNTIDTSASNVQVYTNYVSTMLTPTFNHDNGCAVVSKGKVNHFEIQISQGHLDVYGSDYTPDNGLTFPNYKLLYSANMNMPITRGYVHFSAHNHATAKFGYGPDWVYHWDNIGFDGPVINNFRGYEIPDNTTQVTYNNNGNIALNQNLGYQLQDGTQGKPAGIYDPTNKIGPLVFQNVNNSSVTAVTLTLDAWFNNLNHTPDTTWGIMYRFNGGIWRNRNITQLELNAINDLGSNGNVALAINVPTGDLISGNNTLELLPLNDPMDYPPVVANIDLLTFFGGSSSPQPSSSPIPTPSPVSTPIPASPTPTSLPTPTVAPTSTPLPANVTSIDDSVIGTGLNQFNYQGAGWGHCTSCGAELFNGSNSWSSTAGNTVTVQFSGQQIAFYGVKDPSEGIGAFSIDNGAETMVDFFAATRSGNQLIWTSPVLTSGTHTLKLRVTGNLSGGTTAFVTADRVDVIASATSSCPKGALGDIDCDGKVSILDYSTLVGNYGKTVPAGTQGDLNNSGKIDIFDYSTLVSNYGK